MKQTQTTSMANTNCKDITWCSLFWRMCFTKQKLKSRAKVVGTLQVLGVPFIIAMLNVIYCSQHNYGIFHQVSYTSKLCEYLCIKPWGNLGYFMVIRKWPPPKACRKFLLWIIMSSWQTKCFNFGNLTTLCEIKTKWTFMFLICSSCSFKHKLIVKHFYVGAQMHSTK
jgi:hypothetical protein